jgi:hypothetical protein
MWQVSHQTFLLFVAAVFYFIFAEYSLFTLIRKDEILKTVGIVWECCETFASLPKGTYHTQ